MHVRVALGLVLLLSLSACGDGKESGDPPVTMRSGSPGGQPAGATIGLPYEQFRQLLLAEEKLIQRCMTKAGFTYTPQMPPEQREKQPWKRRDDIAKARREGYGMFRVVRQAESDPHPTAPRRNPDMDGLKPEDKKRYTRTLNGTRRVDFNAVGGGVGSIAVDGCVTEARQALYGDVKQWMSIESLVTNFRAVAETSSMKYPEYKNAEGQWSKCMAKSGFHYPTQDEALDAVYGFYQGIDRPDKPVKKEIDLAVADATCDKRLGTTNVKIKLYERALQESIKQYETEILTYREKQEKALVLARGILK